MDEVSVRMRLILDLMNIHTLLKSFTLFGYDAHILTGFLIIMLSNQSMYQ